MGTAPKKSEKQVKRALRLEEKLDRELKSCMSCRFFWGNSQGCISSGCFKLKKKPQKKQRPEKCEGCPYRTREGYCFPCIRELRER